MKKLLYKILKKDMIKKLREHSRGEQFVDDVMDIFAIPTSFLKDGFTNNGSRRKNNEYNTASSNE